MATVFTAKPVARDELIDIATECAERGDRFELKPEEIKLLLAAIPVVAPIPVLLICPMCHEKHIDEGAFETRPHHTHACQGWTYDYSAPNEKGRRNSFTVESTLSETLHDLLLYSIAAPTQLTDEFLEKAVAELKASRERRIASQRPPAEVQQ